MAELYQRAVKVVVGPKLFEGFRTMFHVRKSVTKNPNSCELALYNLSEDTRKVLQSKGVMAVVQAGYVGTVSNIYSGQIRFMETVREGADWITKVQCGDGEHAMRYTKIYDSFGPNTKVSRVIESVTAPLKKFGIDVAGAVKELNAGLSSEVFTNGYATNGRPVDELDKILRGRGYEFSIQDNRLVVTKINKPSNTVAILLSKDTGMVGSPVYGTSDTKNGPAVLKVKSLLQPSALPTGLVRVASASINGDFRIQAVTHSGDTAGGDWYTEFELIKLGAKVPENKAVSADNEDSPA